MCANLLAELPSGILCYVPRSSKKRTPNLVVTEPEL